MSTRLSLSSYGLVVLAAVGLVVSDTRVTSASDVPVRTALNALTCGDADSDGSVTSTDALLALQAGVSAVYCDPCLCDTSGSNGVTATDALMILNTAVGVDIGVACNACAASVCGDFSRTPFRGAPLGTSVHVADCLLLDPDPNDLESYISVTITKALDTWIAPVPDATVLIDNRGCDCGFLRADSRAAAATTTTLGSCNCMVGVIVQSPEALALVETYIDLVDGDCGDFVGSGTVLIDGGVEEECDDGNQVSGDGCSAECRLEPDPPILQGK